MKWICTGEVCGNCGHTHRTRDAAQRCCDRHAAGIRHCYPSQYPTQAYSDRHPMPLDAEAWDQARTDAAARAREEEWDAAEDLRKRNLREHYRTHWTQNSR